MSAPERLPQTVLGPRDHGFLVRGAVEHARHFLPAQPPLHAFVHHNTLHAFEHLDFDEALAAASRLYGTEPYQSEAAFAAALKRKRITRREVDAVLERLPGGESPLWEKGPQRSELWRFRLLHAFQTPAPETVAWQAAESELFRALHPSLPEASRQLWAGNGTGPARAQTPRAALQALWETLLARTPPRQPQPTPVRLRDRLLSALDIDIDDWVKPLMIRLSGAYLDQGVAEVSMPERHRGFLEAFRTLYAAETRLEGAWLKGLSSTLQAHRQQGLEAEAVIARCLEICGIAEADWQQYIMHTLLALKGWAGMFAQYEEHPERLPVHELPAKLVDYLAVQLLLETRAIRHVLDGRALSEVLNDAAPASKAAGPDLQITYDAFVCAQALGIDAETLQAENRATALLGAVQEFDGLTRRRLLHAAYERHYRDHILDSLLVRRGAPAPREVAKRYAAVFCMDEREESLRRHLEEQCPEFSTYGFAGFFGVPMAYRGLDDIRARPLCPIVVTPRHLVEEVALDPALTPAYRQARRRVGRLADMARRSRAAVVSGGAWALMIGTLKLVPMVGVSLFPRLFHRLTHHLAHAGTYRPDTRLRIEHLPGSPETDGLQQGFTVEEMTRIVAGVLSTMGMLRDFPALVLFVGHGSSSLNNPHEAAHDCGATGGGRGGPNARAFAAMANHPGVRKALSDQGLHIPQSTWFIGSYHNTCDDAMEYFDLDVVPPALLDAVRALQAGMDKACTFDAHERCRRFETAHPRMKPDSALHHAETHANDLAQPRPEYGHATNAVCIIGRRSHTRGLYLDRRAFLISYDPDADADGEALANLLAAAGPVGAGISLEYYFSFIDPVGYGCGTKLPHNISGLIGVMDGHASDLRTGLPWQMVEIHEPMRLLLIVEATPERLVKIVETRPVVATLVLNRWIQVASMDPETGAIHVFEDGRFNPYAPTTRELPVMDSSPAWYQGQREHLPCALISPELRHVA